MRKILVAALLATNVALLASLASGADAHPVGAFYPSKWTANSNVHYNVDNNVPTDMRNGMHVGLGNWDNLAGGAGPHFINDGELTSLNDYDPCTGPSILYVREDLGAYIGGSSEATLGLTQLCVVRPSTGTQRVSKFQVTYELTAELGGANGWYKGSGDPGPNQWDLRSIATHESGHVTGFYGHFNELDEACPLTFNRSTMCPGSTGVKGTTWLRSREVHDNHTFNAAY